jgi:hypothetical protein
MYRQLHQMREMREMPLRRQMQKYGRRTLNLRPLRRQMHKYGRRALNLRPLRPLRRKMINYGRGRTSYFSPPSMRQNHGRYCQHVVNMGNMELVELYKLICRPPPTCYWDYKTNLRRCDGILQKLE